MFQARYHVLHDKQEEKINMNIQLLLFISILLGTIFKLVAPLIGVS